MTFKLLSEQPDSNGRPLAPHARMLANCTMPRCSKSGAKIQKILIRTTQKINLYKIYPLKRCFLRFNYHFARLVSVPFHFDVRFYPVFQAVNVADDADFAFAAGVEMFESVHDRIQMFAA